MSDITLAQQIEAVKREIEISQCLGRRFGMTTQEWQEGIEVMKAVLETLKDIDALQGRILAEVRESQAPAAEEI